MLEPPHRVGSRERVQSKAAATVPVPVAAVAGLLMREVMTRARGEGARATPIWPGRGCDTWQQCACPLAADAAGCMMRSCPPNRVT